MAFKKKGFKKGKKMFKRKFKRKIKNNNEVVVNLAKNLGTLFPDRVIIRAPYVDQYNITQALVSYDEQYRLNSTFDPYFPAGGHQTYGSTQLNAIYNRYVVTRTSWEVSFTSLIRTSMSYTVVPMNSNSSFSADVTSPAEMPYAVTKMALAHGTNGVGPTDRVTIKGGIAMDKLLGVPRATLLSDDRYQALTGANPTEVCNLHLVAFDIAGGAAVNYDVLMKMVFTVEYYDRKPVLFS